MSPEVIKDPLRKNFAEIAAIGYYRPYVTLPVTELTASNETTDRKLCH